MVILKWSINGRSFLASQISSSGHVLKTVQIAVYDAMKPSEYEMKIEPEPERPSVLGLEVDDSEFQSSLMGYAV